jgi:hypothetical protein
LIPESPERPLDIKPNTLNNGFDENTGGSEKVFPFRSVYNSVITPHHKEGPQYAQTPATAVKQAVFRVPATLPALTGLPVTAR